jgi:hypothetical protein
MKRAFLLFLLFSQVSYGAVVERWFAVSSAGAADGTSHANRAALFSAGNWSTVLTGFNFSGTDSLKCYIEAGSYTCSQALTAALFTNAPSMANPLFLVGADTSGAILNLPDPTWQSAQPGWDNSTLPVIATTANINTLNMANIWCYLLNFTASGRQGAVVAGANHFYWCYITNSTANTASTTATTEEHATGCVFTCTGSSYDAVLVQTTTPVFLFNTRLVGNSGATTGNRRGLSLNQTNFHLEYVTVINNPGEGIIQISTSTGANMLISRCTIANNGSTGLKAANTAAQLQNYLTTQCMITGNGAWGIDGNSAAARWVVFNNRLRNNTSGNITGLGNYPTDLNNDTTTGSDSADYVDTASGDFRVKNSSTFWKKFGAGDEAAATAGGGFFVQ